MTQQPDPPVSTALQPALLEPSDSLPLVLDDMGRYVAGGPAIEEGVCRDCGRLLYRATSVDATGARPDNIDVWHPYTVLGGEPTPRFDGILVTSQRGECAGATVGVGRPDPTAFVIGVPLMPAGPEPAAHELPCYICGAEDDHAGPGEPESHDPCPSELTRAAADELRALVGLADIDHPRRRDDRV